MANDKKPVVARVADVLSDLSTLFGLGSKVVGDARDLFTKETAEQLKSESKQLGRRASAAKKDGEQQ